MGNARVLERMRARIATAIRAIRSERACAKLRRDCEQWKGDRPSIPEPPRVRLSAASQVLYQEKGYREEPASTAKER